MRDHLILYVNGLRHRVDGATAFVTLTDFLRRRLRLCGTKVVCSEGDCGACSVLVGRLDGDSLRYEVLDACITFLHQLDLCHVVTVEGLAAGGELHPVQRTMIDHYGSQCGFCTPGFVTTLAGVFEDSRAIAEASGTGHVKTDLHGLDDSAVRRALSGNLCRCTGYWQILEASAAVDSVSVPRIRELLPEGDMVADLGSQAKAVLVQDGERRLFRPADLTAAVAWRSEHPDCMVVAGATDLAVQHNRGQLKPQPILSLGSHLPGFSDVEIVDGLLVAGAGARWSDVLRQVADRLPELGNLLELFGAPQIRNSATVGGNIANASPIADSLPFFYVTESQLELLGPHGVRRVAVEDFYRGYKDVDLRNGELIARVEAPLPSGDETLRLYKMSRRRDLDIASFTAAILLRLDGEVITRARIAYGGVGPTVLRLPRTEDFLIGKTLDEDAVAEAGRLARAEITPISDVRGSAEYRLQLAENVLRKFFYDTVYYDTPAPPPPGNETTPTLRATHPPHDSARGHVTGAAPYVEDLPPLDGELVVDFVPSTCACGVLERIDVREAMAVDGVVGVYTSADIPGTQHFGLVFEDEPFLPAERIDYLGQPLAVIAAETREAALEARRAVRVVVREESPVLTLEEADSKGLYIGPERTIQSGNLERGWRQAEHRFEGTFSSNGQEQFYLESQAALAWPGEGDEIQLHSSTQNPTEIQKVVADVLGRKLHQVVCIVKRMGGAFGGKETQAALPALMAALTVDRTGRPARVVYTKDDDMKSTGKRHAYRTDYRVGFDGDGRIVAAEFRMRSNGGAFADLSTAILERSMLHVDNAYYLPNVSIAARVCRTNLPPNTAFRGFGAPQAMAVIENLMQEISIRIGRDALDIRRVNAYPANLSATTVRPSERRLTPYGQEVRDNLLPEILSRLEESSDYRSRMATASSFNADSRTHLRGLALTPVKFGISFTTKFLNQANALVNVYTDGTVQVSTGATEMGQGVNTKIGQLVAAELGIAVEDVAVMTTSTEKNNNTSPTAASAATDLNGTAAVRAAAAIRERLSDFAAGLFADRSPGLERMPAEVRFESGEVFDGRRPDKRIGFAELSDMARRERVDLGARGFYSTPGIDFDRDAGRGEPFFYFTTGAAVAEVLIDRLTGALRLERLDALLDLGRVLNPGIERGQTIGGLIQGIGWVTAEELVYGDRGELESSSPTTYKIPNITDLPRVLNVDFLENDLNSRNIRSSKAVGEPPLMLALSVWAAVKQALSFVAPGEVPDLRLPATHEQILLCISRMERQQQTSGWNATQHSLR